jgi:hypothetical protein
MRGSSTRTVVDPLPAEKSKDSAAPAMSIESAKGRIPAAASQRSTSYQLPFKDADAGLCSTSIDFRQLCS